MVGWHHWLEGHESSKLRELVMEREAWCAAVHGIAKCLTRPSNWTELIPLTMCRILEVDCNFQWTDTATAKSLQSCPTLCNSIDSSPPGSPVPGILQARTLEWVAISYYYCNYSRNRIPKQESNWHKPSVFIYKWSFLKVSNLILMGTPWSVYGLIE